MPRKEFNIRCLDDPYDRAIEKILRLLTQEFTEDEVESVECMRQSIEMDICQLYVVEDVNGEVLSFMLTHYLVLDPNERAENYDTETILYIAYIITDVNHRGKGFARELYKKVHEDIFQKAAFHRHRLKAIIGDTDASIESFLNHMSRKRIYYEGSDGNIYEVPYIQPPIDMDKHTGSPLYKEVPTHLMIKLENDRQECCVYDLLRIIKSIYSLYIERECGYHSKDAYDKANKYITNIFSRIEKIMTEAKDSKLFLLDSAEREIKQCELQIKGKNLYEHMNVIS